MGGVVEVKSLSGSGSAVFSEDGRYRYRLDRNFGGRRGAMLWVMLNPSIAGAERDDPTITKCLGFARRYDFDRLIVVNLFGLVTPYPEELGEVPDPIGPRNDLYVREAAAGASWIVVAWGTKGARYPVRVSGVRAALGDAPLRCLGRTRDGHPRHPGRIPYATPLERFA